VIIISIQNFINAGITNFNTLIIKGFGFSTYKTILLTTPQAAIAMAVSILCGTIPYFVNNIRSALIFITTGVTMAGIIMIYKIDPKKKVDASLAAVYLCGFYNAPYVLCLSLIESNTTGQTKIAFYSVSVGFFYALGNLIGPQFFLGRESPKYQTGIKAMFAACWIMYGMTILYAILCYFENKRRDTSRLAENELSTDITEIEMGELADKQDLTDHENKHFRYTF
jgi:hypothetical protein